MKTTGIVLIIIGLVMTLITGFNIVTKEKVVDVGKIEITKEEKTPIYWSPITGIILLAAGVILTLSDRKKIA